MKDLSYSVMLDYYGALLSDKQREITELYYNDDLSLAEIAEQYDISRQAVRENIKKSESILKDADDKLHFMTKARKWDDMTEKIMAIATALAEESEPHIREKAESIRSILSENKDMMIF